MVDIQCRFWYIRSVANEIEREAALFAKSKRVDPDEAAEMTNVSRQAVPRWESGVAVPSTDNLKFLGQLYGVPLEYLLCEDAPEPAYVEMESQTCDIKQCRKNGKKFCYL